METTQEPTFVLDCRGVSCPMPVIQTADAIQQVQPGQTLLLLSTDPGVEPDMRAWTSRTGHGLLDVSHDGEAYRVLLRRAG
jgi:tRNA 2-thiouridine synthesizing protein A